MPTTDQEVESILAEHPIPLKIYRRRRQLGHSIETIWHIILRLHPDLRSIVTASPSQWIHIYIVERNEKNLPVAVIFNTQTKSIERLVVDWVYDLPIWVRSRFPDAVRVAPRYFFQECVSSV